MNKIKHPSFAGLFYPEDKKELSLGIDDYLDFAQDNIDPKIVSDVEKIKIIISPHAGYIYSGKVAAFGYWLLKNINQKIEKFVLIGPSHSVYFNGAAVSDFEVWQTPLGKIRAADFSAEMMKKFPTYVFGNNGAFLHEHCLEAQLPFLQKTRKGFKILPILYSDMNSEPLADMMDFVDGEKTVFIVSSDLSHYLPYAKAREIDGIANEKIPVMDTASVSQKTEACGIVGILAAMTFAKRKKLKGATLAYMNSGDTKGSKDSVVGYGSYVFYR